MSLNKIQSFVSASVCRAGVKVRRDGPVQNVFVFSSLRDLFAVGHFLFSEGFFVIALTDYAKKNGVTRQAVDNWVWRDGQRVCLVFEKAGRNLSFIVESNE